jgi:hypothetical protein
MNRHNIHQVTIASIEYATDFAIEGQMKRLAVAGRAMARRHLCPPIELPLA